MHAYYHMLKDNIGRKVKPLHRKEGMKEGSITSPYEAVSGQQQPSWLPRLPVPAQKEAHSLLHLTSLSREDTFSTMNVRVNAEGAESTGSTEQTAVAELRSEVQHELEASPRLPLHLGPIHVNLGKQSFISCRPNT